MNISYGPASDGRHLVTRGGAIVAESPDLESARRKAEHLARSEGVVAERTYFNVAGNAAPTGPGRVVERVLGEPEGRTLTARINITMPARDVEPAPAVAEAEPIDDMVPSFDLSVLKQSIAKLEAALACGEFDAYLQVLLSAEEASGKPRKGAVEALRARMTR